MQVRVGDFCASVGAVLGGLLEVVGDRGAGFCVAFSVAAGHVKDTEAHLVVCAVTPVHVFGVLFLTFDDGLVGGGVVPRAGDPEFVFCLDRDGFFEVIDQLPVEVPLGNIEDTLVDVIDSGGELTGFSELVHVEHGAVDGKGLGLLAFDRKKTNQPDNISVVVMCDVVFPCGDLHTIFAEPREVIGVGQEDRDSVDFVFELEGDAGLIGRPFFTWWDIVVDLDDDFGARFDFDPCVFWIIRAGHPWGPNAEPVVRSLSSGCSITAIAIPFRIFLGVLFGFTWWREVGDDVVDDRLVTWVDLEA